MLKEHAGRNLFALVGSEEANCLFSELFGFPRPTLCAWHRGNREVAWHLAPHRQHRCSRERHLSYEPTLALL